MRGKHVRVALRCNRRHQVQNEKLETLDVQSPDQTERNLYTPAYNPSTEKPKQNVREKEKEKTWKKQAEVIPPHLAAGNGGSSLDTKTRTKGTPTMEEEDDVHVGKARYAHPVAPAMTERPEAAAAAAAAAAARLSSATPAPIDSHQVDVIEQADKNSSLSRAAETGGLDLRTVSIISNKNSSASTITSSAAEIQEAQSSFVCPPGYKLFKIPPASESRSLMYEHGVRVEEITRETSRYLPQQTPDSFEEMRPIPRGMKGKRIAGRFYCMADNRCRERQAFVRVSNKCTSSASDHLSKIHGVVSERSTRATLRKAAERRSDGGGSFSEPNILTKPAFSPRKSSSPGKLKLPKREGSPSSDVYLEDRDRYTALSYVQSHTILGLEPLDYVENDHRKNLWRTLGGGISSKRNQVFPVEMLDSRGIKKGLVEIYHARKKTIRDALQQERQTTPIRFVHISLDFWLAGEDKYIGLRAHHLTRDFKRESDLLAVRRFDPRKGPVQKSEKPVTLWVSRVLEEYLLDWSLVAGVIASKDSDLTSAFPTAIPGVLRECCIPSTLDAAMLESFGLSSRQEVEDRTSKRKAVRNVLAGVQEVVGRVDTRDATEYGLEVLQKRGNSNTVPEDQQQQDRQLWQHAISNRWSGGIDTFERFLVCYPALESYFTEKRGERMDLTSKAELEEVYSLMKSLALVIPACQLGSELSAPVAMLRLVMLLSADLDVTKPLELHHAGQYYALPRTSVPPVPPVGGTRAEQAHEGQEPAAEAEATAAAEIAKGKHSLPSFKQPRDLTEMGQSARATARDAVYEGFASRRWGQEFEKESHLFDMVLALHPGCRQLGYINRLSRSPTLVPKIKSKVYAQIATLAEAVIESERAAMARALPGACEVNDGIGERNPKRLKMRGASPFDSKAEQDAEENDTMASAGVFDSVFEPDRCGFTDEDNGQSAAEEASDATKAWCEAKLPAHYRTIRTGEGLADFWRTYGTQHFRLMSVVARSVLGAPGSAAVLDRELDPSGGFAHNRQSCGGDRGSSGSVECSDRGYSEMAMLLCAAFDSIPEEIPRLSDDEVTKAIPQRFTDPQIRAELRGLEGESMEGTSDGMSLFGFNVEIGLGRRLPEKDGEETEDEDGHEAAR